MLQYFVPELANSDIKYNDIFGTIEQIIPASKLLLKVCKERESLMELSELMENLNQQS